MIILENPREVIREKIQDLKDTHNLYFLDSDTFGEAYSEATQQDLDRDIDSHDFEPYKYRSLVRKERNKQFSKLKALLIVHSLVRCRKEREFNYYLKLF